ncbi:MAG: hypothetical protein Q8943_06315 [Bacteroidota bacterium]|nr:hypothetical protein [Bacteroidota bacterium]
MRPTEPIDPHSPGGSSPVPIPPVEDAWIAMRKRLDREMPVRRKRRRAFWLFFLLLPLLLWWWMERGQGRGSGQTTPAVASGTSASGTSASGNHASGTPGTHASGNSPAATRHIAFLPLPYNPPSNGKASVLHGEPAGHQAIQETFARPAYKPRRRSPAGPADLTRSEIRAELATTASRVAMDLPAPETGNVRRNAAGGQRADKQAKPVKEETRIVFAAGLAANKSFPVGAQQAVDYNANLKKDLWFDYLPTPYFQYHPGRRVASQTGIQFNSPQYTENVAIYRKSGPPIGVGSAFTQDTVLVVRKLYYFNFPLIAYYSPVRNLYLGAGIQYSNLRNGVALQNNVLHYNGSGGGQRDSVQFTKFVTLKDYAPAYGNLRKSDWRGLLELNYYWRRITLGLQYQESLGNYLRTPVEGSQGKDRNSSFNLYLRYNIWEKRVVVHPGK